MDRPICSQLSPVTPAGGQGRRGLPLPPAALAGASRPPRSTGIGAVFSLNAATPFGIWFLRLALGAIFLAHVRLNLFEYVPPNVSQLFGLPPGVSGFSIAWEALVAVALVVGIWPRAAALAGTATLFGGAVAAHASTALANSQFGWQYPLLWIAALIVIAVSGDGAYALVPTARIRTDGVSPLNFTRPMIGGFATGMALALLLWHLV